jgi:tetratricopeptide (TPR) repeat protein
MNPPRFASYRLLLLVLIGSLLLASCRTGPGTVDSPRRGATADPTRAPAPPGLEPREVRALEGEELDRARLSLDEAIAEAPPLDFLPSADAAPRPRAEPPLAAQRAYLLARMTWREGSSFDAIRQLQTALREAPDEPDILRLLGRIYASIGNKVRGSQYLREAVRASPTDVESILWLGRFALEDGRWDEAAALFVAVRERAGAQADPALRRLVQYYLAAALAQQGYAAAAIELYEGYLDGVSPPPHAGPLARELAVLDQQAAVTWQAVGDLHHRLGQPREALGAYERAAEAGPADPLALVRRRVYTHLRLNQTHAARDVVMQQLSDATAEQAGLPLVRYVVEHAGGADAFADHLRAMYEREGRSGSLAIAVAELMPRDQATALLIDHLGHRPGDDQALDTLMRQYVIPGGVAGGDTDRLNRAIHTTARLIAAAPDHGNEFATAFLRVAHDTRAVAAATAALPPEARQQTPYRLIRSLALALDGDVDASQEELELLLQNEPDSRPARTQLARLHIARGYFDRAARVLEPLTDSRDPAVVTLNVHVLSETGRHEEALALLDAMVGSGTGDVSLIVQKASLQLRTGDATAAERTLLDALNVQPHEERLYEELLTLYDPPGGGSSPVADAQRQWNRLVRRLLGTMPYSRIGRLIRAELHKAKNEFPQAEALLRGLLDENDRDARAMRELLELYVRSDRRGDALSLLDRQIERHPRDPQVLLAAGSFYRQLEEERKMLDAVERFLLLSSPSERRELALATLYLEMGDDARAAEAAERGLSNDPKDPQRLLRALGQALAKQGRLRDAERRFEQAMQRHPELAPDLAYERASLVGQSGERERAEALKLRLLERWPEHPATNNDLAYGWLVQNREIERATQMIQRAVDADPGNAAYLDSMGWAYYKQGRFRDAEQWLRKARQASRIQNPVIVDHLGDTLYRMGNRAEAVKTWEEARAVLDTGLPLWLEHNANFAYQQGMVAEAVQLWRQARALREGRSPWEDPEMADLGERLRAKLDAARNDREVPVASLPGEPEPAIDAAADAAGGVFGDPPEPALEERRRRR